jgi:pimeloyl-ACP methyl ester carboxylesterase
LTIIDVGRGTPVVLIPGVQGRWEWMKPAVDALAKHCRVITFSLADEPTSGATFEEDAGFASYVRQVAAALDAAGVQRAVICGVSYGGLIAAAFAARYPDRVDALVLVSALPPGWRPDARVRFYLRAPVLLSPLFCLASLRLYKEIAAASPGFVAGVATAVRHGVNVVTHMFSPRRMARRATLLTRAGINQEVSTVNVPTLVITGEGALDRVVPVAMTQSYLRLWPHARHATLARTGHLGLITRPDAFADIVVAFVEQAGAERDRGRRIG